VPFLTTHGAIARCSLSKYSEATIEEATSEGQVQEVQRQDDGKDFVNDSSYFSLVGYPQQFNFWPSSDINVSLQITLYSPKGIGIQTLGQLLGWQHPEPNLAFLFNNSNVETRAFLKGFNVLLKMLRMSGMLNSRSSHTFD
jgi:hypothetical protein